MPWWLLVKSRLWRLKFSQRVRESTGPCQRKFPYEFIKGVGLPLADSPNLQAHIRVAWLWSHWLQGSPTSGEEEEEEVVIDPAVWAGPASESGVPTGRGPG